MLLQRDYAIYHARLCQLAPNYINCVIELAILGDISAIELEIGTKEVRNDTY